MWEWVAFLVFSRIAWEVFGLNFLFLILLLGILWFLSPACGLLVFCFGGSSVVTIMASRLLRVVEKNVWSWSLVYLF